MFLHVCRALALGKISRGDAERLLDEWRGAPLHQPYPIRGPWSRHLLGLAYKDSRRLRDRRIVAGVVRELAAPHFEDGERWEVSL